MADKPDPRSTIFLSPTETVRVWQERGALRPTMVWSEMVHEEHAGSFTVAKIARLELLATMRESLDEVIRNGGTFEEWKASILPELKRHGWWGVVQNRDLTGTDEAIIVDDRRLRNIYRTNIRMSIAAGRWRKFQSQKEQFPYLRYRSDHFRKHPRLNHRSWHGLILPIDDPTWQWMFPPNGWGCNCRVEQVSEASLIRNGWTVGTPPDPGTYKFITADGREFDVPNGVQPGFGYNPGTAHLQVVADRAMAAIARAIDVGSDAAAQIILREIVADAAYEQFVAMPQGAFPAMIMTPAQQALIAAPSRVVTLPAGLSLPGQTMADYRLLPDVLERAVVIAESGADRLVFFTDEAGAIWRATMRINSGDRWPQFIDLTPSSAAAIDAEISGLNVLQDRR